MILKNRNILITGGGKGIGYHSVINASKEGAFVYTIIKSKIDKKKFKNLKNVKAYIGNVSNTKIIKKILKDSIKDKKIISGLVNNAGIRQRIKFNKINNKNLKDVFETNFFSIFNIMQIFTKHLLKNKLKG